MIQAGPSPALGEGGIAPPAYEAVGRALSAARVPTHPGIGRTFTHEHAQRWLEALDRGAVHGGR